LLLVVANLSPANVFLNSVPSQPNQVIVADGPEAPPTVDRIIVANQQEYSTVARTDGPEWPPTVVKTDGPEWPPTVVKTDGPEWPPTVVKTDGPEWPPTFV
jgi:hypothetical protein